MFTMMFSFQLCPKMTANVVIFCCLVAVIGDRWIACNSQSVEPDSDIDEKASAAEQVFSGKVSRIFLNGRESVGVNLDADGRVSPGIEGRCLVRVKTMLKGADGEDPLLAMFPQRTIEIVLQHGEEDVPRPHPLRVFHTAFFLVRPKEDGTVRLVTRPLEMTLDNIIAVRSAVTSKSLEPYFNVPTNSKFN